MNLKQRVRKLEGEIGEVVVSLRFTYGGVSFHDCKRYQAGDCQLFEKHKPLPEGTKVKFVLAPRDPEEKDSPCDECPDFVRVSNTAQEAEK